MDLKDDTFCTGCVLVQNAPDSLPETFQQEERVFFAAPEMWQRGPSFQVCVCVCVRVCVWFVCNAFRGYRAVIYDSLYGVQGRGKDLPVGSLMSDSRALFERTRCHYVLF